jgi:catechol 2,3-dioxygenase-like lactoylglutathione lyase family enzyme
MLSDAPFHPTLATADLARARDWYAEKIGWEPYLEPPGTLVYQVGDSFFSLYESEFAGSAENTVMNWNVADLRAEVARLRNNGVEFEDYDYGDFKTVDAIMTDPSGGMNAWFRDLDGNIVGVLQGAGAFGGRTLSAMLAAADLDRAKRWYAEKLGFEPVEEFQDVVATYRSGDSVFNVYQTEFAGTAKNTVGIWRLKGIRDEVARLRDRGVVFEDYDFGDEGRTVDGIMSDAEGDVNAWFTDSEGNILALAEDRGGDPA